jgi:hypothetical protein
MSTFTATTLQTWTVPADGVLGGTFTATLYSQPGSGAAITTIGGILPTDEGGLGSGVQVTITAVPGQVFTLSPQGLLGGISEPIGGSYATFANRGGNGGNAAQLSGPGGVYVIAGAGGGAGAPQTIGGYYPSVSAGGNGGHVATAGQNGGDGSTNTCVGYGGTAASGSTPGVAGVNSGCPADTSYLTGSAGSGPTTGQGGNTFSGSPTSTTLALGGGGGAGYAGGGAGQGTGASNSSAGGGGGGSSYANGSITTSPVYFDGVVSASTNTFGTMGGGVIQIEWLPVPPTHQFSSTSTSSLSFASLTNYLYGFLVQSSSSVLFGSTAPNFISGQINSIGLTPPLIAQSKAFASFHNVESIQFATVQSNPLQLIPNDKFQDTAFFQTYEWLSSSSWLSTGDANISFNPSINAAVISRYPSPTVSIGHSMIRPTVSPVMAELGSMASALSQGGIISPPVTPSAQGRLYIAAQVIPLIAVPASNPIQLQLIGTGSTILNTWNLSGVAGQPIVVYYPFNVGDFGPPQPLQVALTQVGTQQASWAVQALSLFDEGIVWEFSVDGGNTFYPAIGIRNNPYGILTFPPPTIVGSTNQLVWKVIFYQPNMIINSLELRPIYQGTPLLDRAIGSRGPSLEFTNTYASIYTSPLFNQTQVPIPREWFS